MSRSSYHQWRTGRFRRSLLCHVSSGGSGGVVVVVRHLRPIVLLRSRWRRRFLAATRIRIDSISRNKEIVVQIGLCRRRRWQRARLLRLLIVAKKKKNRFFVVKLKNTRNWQNNRELLTPRTSVFLPSALKTYFSLQNMTLQFAQHKRSKITSSSGASSLDSAWWDARCTRIARKTPKSNWTFLARINANVKKHQS